MPALLSRLCQLNSLLEQYLERYFYPLAALAARLIIAKVFFDSGLTKINNWETTLFLFQEEYHAPLLSPQMAAVAGTAGELIFPVLLATGLGGRLGALGLSGVNIMAVISYWHVLGLPEQAAGLNQHLLWGVILALLLGAGSGPLSLDKLIQRFCKC